MDAQVQESYNNWTTVTTWIQDALNPDLSESCTVKVSGIKMVRHVTCLTVQNLDLFPTRWHKQSDLHHHHPKILMSTFPGNPFSAKPKSQSPSYAIKHFLLVAHRCCLIYLESWGCVQRKMCQLWCWIESENKYSRHSVNGPTVTGNIQLTDFYLAVNCMVGH